MSERRKILLARLAVKAAEKITFAMICVVVLVAAVAAVSAAAFLVYQAFAVPEIRPAVGFVVGGLGSVLLIPAMSRVEQIARRELPEEDSTEPTRF